MASFSIINKPHTKRENCQPRRHKNSLAKKRQITHLDVQSTTLTQWITHFEGKQALNLNKLVAFHLPKNKFIYSSLGCRWTLYLFLGFFYTSQASKKLDKNKPFFKFQRATATKFQLYIIVRNWITTHYFSNFKDLLHCIQFNIKKIILLKSNWEP